MQQNYSNLPKSSKTIPSDWRSSRKQLCIQWTQYLHHQFHSLNFLRRYPTFSLTLFIQSHCTQVHVSSFILGTSVKEHALHAQHQWTCFTCSLSTQIQTSFSFLLETEINCLLVLTHISAKIAQSIPKGKDGPKELLPFISGPMANVQIPKHKSLLTHGWSHFAIFVISLLLLQRMGNLCPPPPPTICFWGMVEVEVGGWGAGRKKDHAILV